MEPHRYLDPREARPLTSREIAKVLGSVLVPMREIDASGARSALDTSSFLYGAGGEASIEELSAEGRAFVAVFSGLCSGLLTSWCELEELRQALRFWREHLDRLPPDAAWEAQA